MSKAEDAANLSKVQQISGIKQQLQNLQWQVEDMDISQTRQAGTYQWAGDIKSHQYDEAYHNAQSQMKSAQAELDEAISNCQSKMYNLVNQIEDLVMKGEAWMIATF